jgi:Mg-chelatase subunit ChlD
VKQMIERVQLVCATMALAGCICCGVQSGSPSYASAGTGGFDGVEGVAAAGGGAGTVAVVAQGGGQGGAAPLDPTPIMLGPITSSGCGGQEITILFVVDRSGSMNCNLPPATSSTDCEMMSPPAKVDASQPSKWEVISRTLASSMAKLAMLDGGVRMRAGISFFSIDGACGAASTPAVSVDAMSQAHLGAMQSALSKQKPSGGTPIVGATMLAYKHLYQSLQIEGNAHVVLITDGSDSCASFYAAQPSIAAGDQVEKLIGSGAPSALGVGIKTWVIGAPGSEVGRSTLSNLAIAGGTRRSPDCTPGSATDPLVGDCHYDMTMGDFESTLSEVLGHILSVVTCGAIR